MDEQALSMEEPKQKLARLEEHLPDAPNELVYDFGRYLAEYLNQSLVPMGFVMGCMLATHDLQTGTNGFTGKPIQNRLVGYPPVIYGLLLIGDSANRYRRLSCGVRGAGQDTHRSRQRQDAGEAGSDVAQPPQGFASCTQQLAFCFDKCSNSRLCV